MMLAMFLFCEIWNTKVFCQSEKKKNAYEGQAISVEG